MCAKNIKTGGRTKGTPNKVTRTLKDMILGALGDAGGQGYLLQQSKENPTAFMTLIGKVLPNEVKAELSGQNGGAIVTEIIIKHVKPDS